MDLVVAVYRIDCPLEDGARMAEFVAREQSIEAPIELAADAYVRERVLGRVLDVAPAEGGGVLARIGYDAALASGPLFQILNLLLGTISLMPGVAVEDLSLPDPVLAAHPGPRYGIDGIRRLLGVFGRPLLATAVKPRGLPNEELARLAGQFARAGGDLVKDDQNLVEVGFREFAARTAAIHEAVLEANEATGRRCLYLANLAAPPGERERRLDWLVRAGIPGVLVSPVLLGLDEVREIVRTRPLVVLGHPAVAGALTTGPRRPLAPGILFGTLFRMAGADVSIFPDSAGRFPFADEDAADAVRRLREPKDALKPAFPCPAGGIGPADADRLADRYGADAVWLSGGALRVHPAGFSGAVAEVVRRMRERFPERLAAPRPAEDAPVAEAPVVEHLPFSEDFRWAGRPPSPYKSGGRLPFRDVSRHDLIDAGGRLAFDLRYFEVGPGGHTSRERHHHGHAIIAARGRGVLEIEDRRYDLKPFDVAHVPARAVHRLTSDGPEPFGFFCVVDHNRDPAAPPP